MKILSVITGAATLVLLGCSGSEEPATRNQQAQYKIYEGDILPQETFPQVVQIVVYSEDGSEEKCSGTIIGANSVITATHCFTSPRIVGAGIRVLGVEHPVTALAVAPGFTPSGYVIFNDVAIVKSADPLGVPAASLLLSRAIGEQEALWIYGFGLNEDGVSGLLRGGVIYPDVITPNHIIDSVDGGQNTCMGDSGGPVAAPVVVDEVSTAALVGITSSGDGGGCTNQETAYYTNLQNPQIIEFIAANVPDLTVL